MLDQLDCFLEAHDLVEHLEVRSGVQKYSMSLGQGQLVLLAGSIGLADSFQHAVDELGTIDVHTWEQIDQDQGLDRPLD